MVNLAKTEQYTTSWCIDWISATFASSDVSDLDVRRALGFGFPLKAWAECTPHFGYALGMTHPLGHTVLSNPYRPEMGVHIMIGGRALTGMAQAGWPAPEMLKWCLDQGGKITRLDLAIDVFGEAIDPIVLARTPQVKGQEGSTRKHRAVMDNQGGKTSYHGSRTSERFLRVYDKAAEQGLIDTLWTRFEVEVKGGPARVAAQALVATSEGARADLVRSMIKSLFNPDDPVFQGAMNAPHVPLASPGKNTDDSTLEWLMNQVAKSLARTMMRRGDVDVWGNFAAQVHANIKAMGGLGMEGDGDEA